MRLMRATNAPKMRSPFLTSVFVVSALALSACGNSIKWQEDVKLPSGKIVVVNRIQEFEGPSGLGQPSSESDSVMKFVDPYTHQRVEWHGRRYLEAIALLDDPRGMYLVLRPEYGGWRDMRCPQPMYQLFRLKGGEWEWLPLESIPVRRFRANLAIDPTSWRERIRELRGHISTDEPRNIVPGMEALDIDLTELKQQTFAKGGPYRFDPAWFSGNSGLNTDVVCLNAKKPIEWTARRQQHGDKP